MRVGASGLRPGRGVPLPVTRDLQRVDREHAIASGEQGLDPRAAVSLNPDQHLVQLGVPVEMICCRNLGEQPVLGKHAVTAVTRAGKSEMSAVLEEYPLENMSQLMMNQVLESKIWSGPDQPGQVVVGCGVAAGVPVTLSRAALSVPCVGQAIRVSRCRPGSSLARSTRRQSGSHPQASRGRCSWYTSYGLGGLTRPEPAPALCCHP